MIKAHRPDKERNSHVGFLGGAGGLQHLTEMAGADCCITINWKGTADKQIEKDAPDVDGFYPSVAESALDELLE